MLKKIFLGLLVVIVLVLVFHSFIIGTLVKPQAEQQISKLLGTDVKISVLSVRLWPGNAAVYGLKIKNPEGFSEGQLLDLGSFSVAIDVPGLMKQYTSRNEGAKHIVVDHIKIKGLKLFFEKLVTAQGPQTNFDKLIENMNKQTQPAAEKPTTTQPSTTPEPAEKPIELSLELKQFSFIDGKVTVHDATIGSGFNYVVDKINVDFKNIFFPAKPATDLVETLDVSAELGQQNPGTVSLKGRSNLMAGANIDAQLSVKSVSVADFNAFMSEQPFQIAAGKFDLESAIKILGNQLSSQHQLKLASLELKGKQNGALLDLPMQTLSVALSRLPSLDVPFEVNGDLKNPQFKVTQAIKAAISASIQRVLAGGLGDLKGLATDLQSQALGIAGENAEKLTGDAKKLVQGLTGESSETLDKGMKKLSGFLSKAKQS